MTLAKTLSSETVLRVDRVHVFAALPFSRTNVFVHIFYIGSVHKLRDVTENVDSAPTFVEFLNPSPSVRCMAT